MFGHWFDFPNFSKMFCVSLSKKSKAHWLNAAQVALPNFFVLHLMYFNLKSVCTFLSLNNESFQFFSFLTAVVVLMVGYVVVVVKSDTCLWFLFHDAAVMRL